MQNDPDVVCAYLGSGEDEPSIGVH
jgi:hypothetical protein